MKAQTCGLWFGPHIPGPVHFLRWNHATQTGKSWIKPGEVNFTFGMRFQKHNPSNNIWNGTFFASKQLSEAGRGTTIVNPKFVPAHNSTLVGGGGCQLIHADKCKGPSSWVLKTMRALNARFDDHCWLHNVTGVCFLCSTLQRPFLLLLRWHGYHVAAKHGFALKD